MKLNFKHFVIVLALSVFTFSIHNLNNYQEKNNLESSTNDKYFSKVDENLPNGVTIISMLAYNSELFVGTMFKGLFVRLPGSEIFVQVDEVPTNSYIRNIAQDKDKNIWLSTWNKGIWERKIGTSEFIQTPALLDVRANILFADNENNLLIGTRDKGLIIKKAGEEEFKPDPTWNNAVINVEAVAQDSNGNLWVGTLGNGLYEKIKNESKYLHVTGQGIPERIRIETIYLDNQNNLWVGTNKNGLWKKNSKNKIFEKVENYPGASLISAIVRDYNGDLWVGAGEYDNDDELFGLYENSYNTNNFTKINRGLKNDVKVSSIIQDSENNSLYVGTYNYGLYAYGYQPLSKKLFPYWIIIGTLFGLVSLFIIIIAIDTIAYNKMGFRNFFEKNNFILIKKEWINKI